jgi:hypothetical protein
MPLGNWNLEWLSHNANRAYPIAADGTRQNTTGDFTIPDNFLVSMYLSIHAGNNVQPGQFFIKTLSVSSQGFTIVVGYRNDDDVDITVASANIPRATHELNTVYTLTGVGNFSDCTGHLVIGSLSEIDQQPAGLWQFDMEQTRLEPDVIRPQIRGIAGLYIRNNGTSVGPITGYPILQAGSNCRIDLSSSQTESDMIGQVTAITGNLAAGYTITITDEDFVDFEFSTSPYERLQVAVGDTVEDEEILAISDPVLTINAIEGEGLNEECACTTDVGLPIRTINGVTGDSNRNITLLGDNCISFEEGTNSLQVKDNCSEPCCGCEYQEVITNNLEGFGSQARTLENFITSLEASVRQMDLVVLGSRLGDRGCTNI